MRKLLRIAGIAALATAISIGPIDPIAATEAAHAQSPAKLKKQVRKYKRRAALYRRQRNRALDELGAANVSIGNLENQLTAETAESGRLRALIGPLQTQNAQLRQGLPNAIRAVPQESFLSLVLIPARDTWPCDSTYTSPGYWSIDFQSLSFCF